MCIWRAVFYRHLQTAAFQLARSSAGPAAQDGVEVKEAKRRYVISEAQEFCAFCGLFQELQ